METDHRALQWLDRLKDNNMRLTRWSLFLQAYDYKVCYRPGMTNGNADALSRIVSDKSDSGEGGRNVKD